MSPKLPSRKDPMCIDCGLTLGRLIPTHKTPEGRFLFCCLGCWWERGYATFFHRAKGETELEQIERLWNEARGDKA